MEEFHCLVCNQEMQEHNKILYIDYACSQSGDHHFSWRIKDNSLRQLRIRFEDPSGNLILKLHYDEGYSQVYTTTTDKAIRIEGIIYPDFANIDKLKNKLRTILVFG